MASTTPLYTLSPLLSLFWFFSVARAPLLPLPEARLSLDVALTLKHNMGGPGLLTPHPHFTHTLDPPPTFPFQWASISTVPGGNLGNHLHPLPFLFPLLISPESEQSVFCSISGFISPSRLPTPPAELISEDKLPLPKQCSER